MRYTFLAIIAANWNSVSAALYATLPIADTVYSAGHLALITWVDDGHKPHLKDMGPVKLDLYAGNNDYITTLAEGVIPITRSHTVPIPADIGDTGSDFTLRFISTKPPSEIYTADFTITNTNTMPPAENTNITQVVLPNTTSTSPTTTTLAAATTVYANPLRIDGRHQVRNGDSATRSKRIDREKVKFRLVFIMWPALIGISMAL